MISDELTARPDAIDRIISRAGALYSLPAVAVEVLRLTEHAKADVRALKECIERDPALTVKILRVVNSSLFGLTREVTDLNQALALLGIKPLKLLALGFSLPETLFVAAAREQLDWYWRSTLVRAVAAREISEQFFHRSGDDAFLAGLLQDLGVLVLLGQLGRPYAAMLNETMAARADLCQLEQAGLGFDHRQLTGRLLDHWNLPAHLVAPIVEPHDHRRWARSKADHAHLVRVLHLAELFAQLVGQRRLSVLPDLLEAGAAYCDLDRGRLNDLMAVLEPKVKQLAGVLSLRVSQPGGYTEILLQAHEQMSRLAESIVGTLSRGIAQEAASPIECEPQEMHALTLARQLRASFEEFFGQGREVPAGEGGAAADALALEQAPTGGDWSEEGTAQPRLPAGLAGNDLSVRVTLAVGQCRSLRKPLGTVLLAIEGVEPLRPVHGQHLQRIMSAAVREVEAASDVIAWPSGVRRLMVLAGCDRMETVTIARTIVARLRGQLAPIEQAGLLPACNVAAGVAWVDTPAKNFCPVSLVEAADRCLAAATAGGVKSVEVR